MHARALDGKELFTIEGSQKISPSPSSPAASATRPICRTCTLSWNSMRESVSGFEFTVTGKMREIRSKASN